MTGRPPKTPIRILKKTTLFIYTGIFSYTENSEGHWLHIRRSSLPGVFQTELR